MDWSYALLSASEQQLFARLSVFVGRWPLAAAEAICSGDGIARQQILDLVGALVDKSLVTVARGDATRYRLLEPVRQSAAEWLNEAGCTEQMRDRHRDWYLELVELAEPEWWGPTQTDWLERLEDAHENLRAALTWSLTTPHAERGPELADVGLRLVGALADFWRQHGYATEGRRWLEQALASAEPATPPAVRARALSGAALLAWMQQDYPAARPLAAA